MGITVRHNRVRDCLFKWAKKALFMVEKEKPGLLCDGRKPADIFIKAYREGVGHAFDVTDSRSLLRWRCTTNVQRKVWGVPRRVRRARPSTKPIEARTRMRVGSSNHWHAKPRVVGANRSLNDGGIDPPLHSQLRKVHMQPDPKSSPMPHYTMRFEGGIRNVQ